MLFRSDVIQEQSEPFAHMLPNKTMIKALRAKAHELGVEMRHQETVESFVKGPATTSIQLGSGKKLEAKLLIAADGVRSRLRDAAGIKTVHWSYDQMGVVITVAHERPHKGIAEEHFLPAGPFAILPLKGNQSSLVWTESTKDAKRMLAMMISCLSWSLNNDLVINWAKSRSLVSAKHFRSG